MPKDTPTTQKLRGQYPTPVILADFLTSWAIRSKHDKILEPSCGNGIFIESAFSQLIKSGAKKDLALDNITGVEYDFEQFTASQKRVNSLTKGITKFNIIIEDFFSLFLDKFQNMRFDVVVGNPPFVRYQNFNGQIRLRAAEILHKAGIQDNHLMNIWVPFAIACTLLLSDKGRIAMIIPAELLQVKYANTLRLFFSKTFNSITIITFKKLIFPAIQQEIILLLGEKASGPKGIRVLELEDSSQLKDCGPKIRNLELKRIDHSSDKWIQYFLTNEEIILLKHLKGKQLILLGSLAEVDVGIVTGRNEFFVVSNNLIKELNLEPYAKPIVSRTAQIKGSIYTASDWLQNNQNGDKCNLLYFVPKDFRPLTKSALRYILEGEKQEIHKGFKCRIRHPWYVVPSVWTPDAFLFRQIYLHPRMSLNETKASTTDTIHRMRLKKNTIGQTLTICFHNSVTFAFAEVLGRSYGGGVLELEPNEAEELPIPYFNCKSKILHEIDTATRDEVQPEQILEITDKLLLKDHLGLVDSEIKMIRSIWKKLSERRLHRK